MSTTKSTNVARSSLIRRPCSGRLSADELLTECRLSTFSDASTNTRIPSPAAGSWVSLRSDFDSHVTGSRPAADAGVLSSVARDDLPVAVRLTQPSFASGHFAPPCQAVPVKWGAGCEVDQLDAPLHSLHRTRSSSRRLSGGTSLVGLIASAEDISCRASLHLRRCRVTLQDTLEQVIAHESLDSSTFVPTSSANRRTCSRTIL